MYSHRVAMCLNHEISLQNAHLKCDETNLLHEKISSQFPPLGYFLIHFLHADWSNSIKQVYIFSKAIIKKSEDL